MTRRKRKQQRLDDARLQRAKDLEGIDPHNEHLVPPPGAVMADPEQLRHNNTYAVLPRFYVDRVVVCRQCGKEEVWPAARQKWWYEVAKGNINTEAVLCRACRKAEQTRREEARRQHLDGLARKRQRVEP